MKTNTESSHAAVRSLDREVMAAIRERVRPGIEERLVTRKGPDPLLREVLVCHGGACISCHAVPVADLMEAAIEEAGLAGRARVVRVGCMGLCDAGPLVLVTPDGVYYPRVTEELAGRIVKEHLSS
ncbi:MAG: (2Fe-2S) ferredoxin domain-containing protein, partial [Acidobacteriota bacterium]